QRAHVRVDVINSLFPARVRAYLDVLALAVLLIVAAALVYYAAGVVMTSYRIGARTAFSYSLSLWWFQAAWLLGLCVFFLTAVAMCGRAIAALYRGDYKTVGALAGGSDTEDEVKAEIDAARQRVDP